jgi:CRISPR-associated protein Csy1
MADYPGKEKGQRARMVIEEFLRERLTTKLDKLPDDDPKRSDVIAQHQRTVWLEDAARRVRQIQAVTHSLKPIHPDARGTNLYVAPSQLPVHGEVGSHILGEDFVSDVVGNAAALDVYKLLKLEVDGQALLDALLVDDPAIVAALSDDAVQAKEWQVAFVGLVQLRDDEMASHVRAKQLYWLAGNDPTVDSAYHLLAPLYATSLAHAVYGVLQEDRFGEANKTARQARREGRAHDGVFRDYRGLAVQKMGGTKPQNISQLNSERGGNNYLLGSLPPKWRSRDLRMPWHVNSIFEGTFGNREVVRNTLRQLLRFLERDPASNRDTRNQVDAYIDTLIDELAQMAGEWLRVLEPGWSHDERCELVRAEQLWLDPQRAESDEEFRKEWLWMDWPAQIGSRFANWLNSQLGGKLPVGDAEHRQWKKELLVDESPNGWAQELHRLSKKLDSARLVAVQEGME